MCGITGIINFNKNLVKETSIRQMMQIMKHRGPDDEGVFLEDNVGFGFVRLSIIDLSSSGHQPMISIDDRYVIVFNGEIYNYIELRKELQNEGIVFKTQTDTEVLLNAYIKWGEDCLHRFNGMFSFIIYDKLKKNIFIARDRFGIKPFYYYLSNDIFVFSSEITPIINVLAEKPEPNYQIIFDFLLYNRTDHTEETFFKNIKKLQHGCKMLINLKDCKDRNSSKFIIHKWYNLRKEVDKNKGFKNPAEFKEMLISAIKLRLRSDVPIGVCFSGGLDSSSIVNILLNEFDKSDLNTFSSIYKKGDFGDESEFIELYKTSLKNMFYISPDAKSLHKDLITYIRALQEPISATGPYAQFKVMELAKGKVIVTLDGQGADEELAGYHYFYGFYFKELLINLKIFTMLKELYYYLIKHKGLMGIKSFLYFLLPGDLRTKALMNNRKYINKVFLKNYNINDIIAESLYGSKSLKDALLDHFEYKLEHLLKWEDRNSMWFSIESRVPFLDYRLVEKILATASNMKIRNGMTKYLLRESMKGILPEKIRLRRDKIGFDTPLCDWFREDMWQKTITEIFNSDSFKSRIFINHKKCLKLIENHFSGKTNNANEIWKLIHLEIWFREFIDVKSQ